MSLTTHQDKFRMLETILAEHESFKQEIQSLRMFMEVHKKEDDVHDRRDRDDDYMSDDDDTRSVGTVVPHELDRVDEEDELDSEDEERRRRRDELGRPRTPEPTGMGDSDDDESESKPLLPRQQPIPQEMEQRLTTLSHQLESALELSRSLQAQHASAQMTICQLEGKVSALESLIQTTQSHVQAQNEAQQAAIAQVVDAVRIPVEERERDRESITEMINEWKRNVEVKWSSVQEEWNAERDRLKRARDEWENKAKSIEEGIVSKVESTLVTFQHQQRQQLLNGNTKYVDNHGPGLVTPPSPRSLSSDSMRPRSRKKRSGSSRGRSRSSPPSSSQSQPATDDEQEHVRESLTGLLKSPRLRPPSPWATDESSDSEVPTDSMDSLLPVNSKDGHIQLPITPESSSVTQSEQSDHIDHNNTISDQSKRPSVSFLTYGFLPPPSDHPSNLAHWSILYCFWNAGFECSGCCVHMAS
jgi:hypothetical protein